MHVRGRIEMHTRVNLKEIDYLENLGVDGRMTKSVPD